MSALESRICRICRRLLIVKKRRVLLASLQASIGQKRIDALKTKQGRLRGRQVLLAEPVEI
jgi:hypothetical protein